MMAAAFRIDLSRNLNNLAVVRTKLGTPAASVPGTNGVGGRIW